MHNPILESQNINLRIKSSTIIQNISHEHILNKDSILNMCQIGNTYPDKLYLPTAMGELTFGDHFGQI